MILDIIIVVIVVLLFVIGFKRGIVKTLYDLICIAVTGFVSYLGSRLLADIVYKHFILKPITDSVNSAFDSAAVNSKIVSQNVFDSIPGFFSGILNNVGITQKGFELSLKSASDFSEKFVIDTVNKVIGPVIISLLCVLIFAVLFAVLFFLLKRVFKKLVLHLAERPVLKTVNAILGGLLGLSEGILIVLILITVIRISDSFLTKSFITKELIDSSLLFNIFYNWGFTGMISNLTG